MVGGYISGPNRVLGLYSVKSPSLRDLQHQMAALLLESNTAAGLEELFTLPAGVSAAERLQVYARGYPARLHEALEDAFPAVAHIVGHSAFHALTERYLTQRPPLYYNINDAGAGLPRFLRTDALVSDLPFLPDLAELEWSLVDAFNAHTGPPIDAAQLASLGIEDWDSVVLRLQAGLRVLSSAWPIRELWEARETRVETIDIDLDNRPDQVLIYRHGYDVRCESTSADEASALAEIKRGRPLGAIANDLVAQGCDDDAVSAWFGRWMALGLIAAVTSP